MKKTFKKIQLVLQRIINVNLSAEKQELIVWNSLKKLHRDAEWRSGVYEKEKYIESIFEISEGISGTFYYVIYDYMFHCRVKVLKKFPAELTTEIFVLASHFNNLITFGRVEIDVPDRFVEFHCNCEVVLPLIFRDELYNKMLLHCRLAKDMYWAFDKLVLENEAPAIIIADLLKKNEDKESQNPA
jgi:hypothetical protein